MINRTNSYDVRIFLLSCAILVVLGLVGIRLFALQVLQHGYYSALASNQHGSETTILPKRGEIYLTSTVNGDSVLVATNLARNTLYVNQKQISNPAEAAAKLSPMLEIPIKDLTAKLTGQSGYLVIKKQLSDETAAKIKKLNLTGVFLQQEDLRFYPEKNLASNVIGFLGFKNDQRVGQYGVEGKFEEELAGKSGIEGVQKDASGIWITPGDRTFIPATDGDDIYLTLDPAIQFKAEQVLRKTVETHGADSGSVIVINPKTGAVLALADMPDFDPNNYGKVKDVSVYSNEVLTADYEPGSIFKAITLAAAINEGKITPQTTFNNTGSLQVDDKVIKNSSLNEFLGEQNMVTVLDESLNTGAIFAQQQIGNEKFKDYVTRFGFGKPANFELSNIAGNIQNLSQKGNVFFATASFGQGITVTPLQMVGAYSAIANSGKKAGVHIISKIVHPDGSQDIPKPADPEQILDPKTASTVSAMLVDVVENGHGKRAAVKGYYIAGKTGTAQVAFRDKAGYDPNRNIGSFIGFGPVDNPQFLMLVRIDNPKDVKFAESTAAPAFGEIAAFILNYLQVPPSRQ